ncbi:uncharacterized protein LOC105839867 [Monomorium pharaonis]|uniref:uncharacterized protein LOC105839867 n=1 Tax=Monomorium pharaonis TaxID=307658 RepID=UPI00063F25D6|nr:uncharacterized protein LOC105839867 [Monomorium pharaonis]XP_012541921.1 uncharacterized protein LOC105839867 [Monomorium pharaonis]
MKFVYVIVIFTSLVSAELEVSNINNENSSANINNVVDRFVPQISQFIIKNGLDPLNLPTTNKKLWQDDLNSQKITPMMYKADLVLHSGILKYLSNLKRHDNAFLNYDDNVLKLDVGFEFQLLEGTYDYTVKLVFFNLYGRIFSTAADVRAKIAIGFDIKNTALSLDEFNLQIQGDVKIVIEGGLEWLNSIIAKFITLFFRNTITDAVQEEAANAIRTYLDEINHVIAANQIQDPGITKNLISAIQTRMLIL